MQSTSKQLIFSHYLFQKVFWHKNYGNEASLLTPLFINKQNLDDGYKLLLNNLCDITDEHAMEIAKNGGYDLELTDLSKDAGIRQAKYWAMQISNGSIVTNYILYQYLLQQGYALPQTVIENGVQITYSVDMLVDLGIYELKPTN